MECYKWHNFDLLPLLLLLLLRSGIILLVWWQRKNNGKSCFFLQPPLTLVKYENMLRIYWICCVRHWWKNYIRWKELFVPNKSTFDANQSKVLISNKRETHWDHVVSSLFVAPYELTSLYDFWWKRIDFNFPLSTNGIIYSIWSPRTFARGRKQRNQKWIHLWL